MSWLSSFFGLSAPTPARNPDDDRWWDVGSYATVSGERITPERALKISTVYACTTLLAETIAGLPQVIYRWVEDREGRVRARNNPLYRVLHDEPNSYQTPFEFTEQTMLGALMSGSGYSEIKSGRRGFVDELLPIHPSCVLRKELLSNNRVRYVIRDSKSGEQKVYNQDDIFEVAGMSLDGVNTVSVVSFAKNSFGLALAAENYGSRFYRNDTRPGGVLKTPNKLSKEAGKRLKAQWEAAHAGGNQHRVAVLEHGLEWQQIGVSPDEAQFLGTREFQAEDICRWYRIPPHMVGLTSKATSWGSGIEQLGIGFVTYTLRPWLKRWSQAVKRDLLLDTENFFVDFVVEDLLKGDISSRYDAYAVARQWGWMSVNEIRRRENMNPIDNGDVYLSPMNMSEATAADLTTDSDGAAAPPYLAMGAGSSGHYRLLAEEAAGRVVRKEIAAMSKAWVRSCGDRTAFATAVLDFYEDHAAFVAQSMRMPLEKAVEYAGNGKKELLTGGKRVMDDWDVRRVTDLADRAIGSHGVA